MSLRVELTGTDEVRAMFRRLAAPLQREALAATAEDARDYVRDESGKHTRPLGSGMLEASRYLRQVGPLAFEVGHDTKIAKHAEYVIHGTRPHLIKPKAGSGKKSLRFAHGNGWVFAKVVHHPGYKGDNWMQRAAQRAPIDFARHVARIVARET